jgi:hypothetical protein
MSKIIFKGCKQLDFEPNYINCELVQIANHVCWERLVVPYENAPRLVQFCKLRGRLNNHFSCVNGNKQCSEYNEVDIIL